MRTALPTFAAALLLVPTVGRADGLIRQLPKDGAWVSFYCAEEFDDGAKRELYVTIQSVGREDVKGEPCRWLELKYQRPAEWPHGKAAVWKVLVPEKQFGPGGDPLGHVVKSWYQEAGEDAVEEPVGPILPRLHLVLPTPITGSKEVRGEQHFDWQKGRLTSTTALVGTARHVYKVETVKAAYRVALSAQVPFGVAGMKVELESSIGYKGTVQFWLVDMGAGATSAAPDAK